MACRLFGTQPLSEAIAAHCHTGQLGIKCHVWFKCLAPVRCQAIIWTSAGLFTDAYMFNVATMSEVCAASAFSTSAGENHAVGSHGAKDNIATSFITSTSEMPLALIDNFHFGLCRILSTNTMMTSSNGNIFRVTGPLCGEFTGDRWIPLTKASDADLWCLLWSAPWINSWVINGEAGDLRRHRAHYDVIVVYWKRQ